MNAEQVREVTVLTILPRLLYRNVVSILALCALLLLTVSNAHAQAPIIEAGTFTSTGSLTALRYWNTATLLPNGKVLLTGGQSTSSILSSAELYDPAAGTFTATGNMSTARSAHTATLLSNGFVLIAGGSNSGGTLASAELYNPVSGTFSTTGNMNAARSGHTATLLNNGMVLMVGGYGSLSSVELYNPATGAFALTGSLATGRYLHAASLLNNGKVLIAGGYNGSFLSSAQLYDPTTGTFSTTGSLSTARYWRSPNMATLLNSGLVLIAGGNGSSGYLSSAELYNPGTGTFTATGSMNTARYDFTETLLSNGLVLVAGTQTVGGGSSVSSELYNPSTGTFNTTANLTTARHSHAAALLNNGKVLIASGYGASSAELYQFTGISPSSGATGTTVTITGLNFGATRGTSTVTFNGSAVSNYISWSNTSIAVQVPGGGTTGGVVVTVGGVSSNSVTFTVNYAPTITSTNGTTFTVGSAGAFTVTATGFPAPAYSESGTLPSGVTFNTSTHVLGGTPASGTSGTYPITFTANNGISPNAVQNFTLNVSATSQAPQITSANLTSFTVGTVGSFTVTATGSPTPTLSETGALPIGVSFNNSTGVLSGNPVPGTAEIYPMTFTAHNTNAPDAIQNFILTVNGSSSGTVYYYLGDQLGTSRIVTDSSGAVCYDADFEPYGGERAYTNYCDPDYKFTGKERDEESGLDDFGARYYSSQYGRFMTPDVFYKDSHVGDPQSWNEYAYARNNPLRYTDPTGETATVSSSCTTDVNNHITCNVDISASIAIYSANGANLSQQQLSAAASTIQSSIQSAWSGTTIQDGVTYNVSTQVSVTVAGSQDAAMSSGAQNVIGLSDGNASSGADSFVNARLLSPMAGLQGKDTGIWNINSLSSGVAAHEFTHLLGVGDKSGSVLSNTQILSDPNVPHNATASDFGWGIREAIDSTNLGRGMSSWCNAQCNAVRPANPQNNSTNTVHAPWVWWK